VSPDYMVSGWYYARAGTSAGNETGPLTWEELYLLAQAGTLAPADIVWHPKLPRGVTAGLVPGLFATPPEAPAVQPVQRPMPAPQPVPAPQPPMPQPVPAPQPAVTPVQVSQPNPVPRLDATPGPAAATAPQWDIPPAAGQASPAPAPQTAPEDQDLPPLKPGETGVDNALPQGPEPAKKERQNRNLPWLVVLLVLVIAAAAVAAYFLYFRDTSGSNESEAPLTTAARTTNATVSSNPTSAVWTVLATSGDTPAPRGYFAMAYDPTTESTILFGGSAGDTKFGDTWAFDLTSKTWTKMANAGSSPPARDYCQMVYDPVGNKILLFGGAGDSGDLNDLWAFDVTTDSWTKLKPSGTPPPAREGHAMVYEPNKKQVLVFGGLSSDDGALLNDLWSYDPAAKSWAKIDPSGLPPSERGSATMAYVPATQRVLLFGGFSLGDDTETQLGDLWAFDPVGDSWEEVKPASVTPSARLGQAMVSAPALGGLFLFAGRSADADLDDSWMFDWLGDTWTQLQLTQGSPQARDGQMMVYDSSAGAIVLFGGFDSSASLDLGDTWVFGPAQTDTAL
jgi:N-acetylneuraminic acid mutarotase